MLNHIDRNYRLTAWNLYNKVPSESRFVTSLRQNREVNDLAPQPKPTKRLLEGIKARLSLTIRQPWFGGFLGSLLPIVFGVFLMVFEAGKGFRDWSYDLLFLATPSRNVEDVVIVELTETCYNTLNTKPGALDRTNHANLVTTLKNRGARMIVFDILFIDKADSTNAADHLFAAAIRDHGKVILAAQLDLRIHQDQAQVRPPIELFRDAAAGWGTARIRRDSDFSARRHHWGTDRFPSLAWRAAELMDARVTKDPLRRTEERWMNYYAEEPFRILRYSDVIMNTMEVANFSFSNKVVFVGSGEVAGFTGEEKEQFRYPWTWLSEHFPFGVEMHALTFSNLWHHGWLHRIPEWCEILVLIVCGGVFGYGLAAFRPLSAVGISLLAFLFICLMSYALFAQWNLWFPYLIIVAVQIPLALAWSILFNAIRSYIEKQFLDKSLSLYLSPQQVKQMLKNPDRLKPGGVKQKVSVLFSDIAGYSKHCELKNWDPNEIMGQLNHYYETAIKCIHQTDGTVMELMGDAIFAVWNAPQEQADHQERACRSALLLHQALVDFDKENILPWRTRVGLHSGEVCIGNIGSSTHFDYTAVGEPINLASRLEGLNKYISTNLLATGTMQKAAGSTIVSRLVGNFRFKEVNQVIEVYEIVGSSDREEATRAWRNAFTGGLRCFYRREFETAKEFFGRAIELRLEDYSDLSYRIHEKEKDGPSSFYLDKIANGFDPPSDWMGEIEVADK